MKVHNCSLVVGIAMLFIASTLSGKDIMPCFIILKLEEFQFISGEKGFICIHFEAG